MTDRQLPLTEDQIRELLESCWDELSSNVAARVKDTFMGRGTKRGKPDGDKTLFPSASNQSTPTTNYLPLLRCSMISPTVSFRLCLAVLCCAGLLVLSGCGSKSSAARLPR